MDTEPDETDGYRIHGLSPSQARQLFEAFGRAGIHADVEFIQESLSIELEGDSGETAVIITVDGAFGDAARRIAAGLFGE